MQFTSRQIADLVSGQLLGNPDVVVQRLAKIEEAGVGTISFISNPKYLHHLQSTEASVLIVSNHIELNGHKVPAVVVVDDPYSAFSKLLGLFNQATFTETGIEQPSFVANSAQLGQEVYVGAFAYIGENVVLGDGAKIMQQVYLGKNVKIGPGSILHPGVRVLHDCEIGAGCVIHANVVIGSDGFGFAPQKEGHYEKIAQNGKVIIEDNVEIGANCAIDRATMGATYIRKGVKLDNLVHIAHNVEVGENTVIAAQTGVSGSTRIDKQCVIAGQVGFAGHVYVAPGSQIGGQTGVTRSLNEPGQKWNGTPVMKYMDSQRTSNLIRKLPDFEKRILQLEKFFNELNPTTPHND
ncbi:MAG: UDP-3-O-(3-hydroxymyristoyl)glucosamine N-acyltransferase [Sphingobacteriaceae bacterium]|nr:UDP-3-O-(3-hydroxymyristoyl)glucosamine N-acyltransferase [Sphingobacteriaceae bacterium]